MSSDVTQGMRAYALLADIFLEYATFVKSVIHLSWFFHVRFSFSAGYGQFPVVCALALGGSYGSMTARSSADFSQVESLNLSPKKLR